MATTKKTSVDTSKMTPTQMKRKIDELEKKIETFKDDTAWCYMCGKPKLKEHFYVCTDPMIKSGKAPICKACAEKIALQTDKKGVQHEPTKESVRKALFYLNKPFLNSVWDASIQESEDLTLGKTKSNVWTSYVKNIAMVQHIGLNYSDSDFFNINSETADTTSTIANNNDNEVHGVEYEDYIRNKNDAKKLLGYDPFEQEAIADQPLLYGQLIGMLDSGGEGNEDMVRNASIISIVRGFLQSSKIDNSITKLMSDINNIEKNSATIKSLQDSKSKLTGMITSLAAESCISLKNNKNAKKGENTWTGKIKKIKELNLREGEVNGFDMATCRAMKQVMDLSNESIMQQLHLDESEWSDIVADQRKMIVELQEKLEKYEEISRILLRENLDIKDCLKEKGIDLGLNMVNLNSLYSCFSEQNSDIESEDTE